MEERRASETYQGHKIQVTAYEQRTNAWSWGYSIDGKVFGESARGAMLPDAEAALRRGMLAARARVGQMG
jgi:hypothetical protein